MAGHVDTPDVFFTPEAALTAGWRRTSILIGQIPRGIS